MLTHNGNLSMVSVSAPRSNSVPVAGVASRGPRTTDRNLMSSSWKARKESHRKAQILGVSFTSDNNPSWACDKLTRIAATSSFSLTLGISDQKKLKLTEMDNSRVWRIKGGGGVGAGRRIYTWSWCRCIPVGSRDGGMVSQSHIQAWNGQPDDIEYFIS